MKFVGLTPEIFWSILGALTLIIGLLYVIKMRRRRVTVPFSPIWDRVLQSNDANRWWDRFKRLLSFLLQVVLAALVMIAIADPRSVNEREVGRNIILLIDTSASMGALDVSGGVDRLDIARQESTKILESMGPLDSVMLVTMDGQLKPLTPFVKDVAIVKQSLKDLKTTATPADIAQAMQFVRDASVDKSDAELYFFSDGIFKQDIKKAIANIPSTLKFKHIKTGESGNNIAITAFNVRRYFANKLNYEIYISVQNYFDREVSLELKLLSDGQIVEKKPLTLPAGESKGMFFPNEGFVGKELEARVVLTTSDARDVFPLDDRAYAILPSSKRVNVALVSGQDEEEKGNMFIEAALVSNSNVEYTLYSGDDWTPELAVNHDIVILDRFVPETMPAKGNFMFFAPPEGNAGPWKVGATFEKPTINRKDKKHPIMRWVTLQDANITSARRVSRTKGDDVAAAAGKSPMIVSLREGDRNLVLFSFDFRQTDLLLKVALPLLMLNSVDFFMDEGNSIVPTYKTGTAWSVPVSKQATTATITEPDGSKNTLPVYQGRAIFYGEQTGFHTFEAGGETFQVAANLADPIESKILPIDPVKIEGREIVIDPDAIPVKRQEYWVYFVLAALALLLVEWLTYNRRWTV